MPTFQDIINQLGDSIVQGTMIEANSKSPSVATNTVSEQSQANSVSAPNDTSKKANTDIDWTNLRNEALKTSDPRNTAYQMAVNAARNDLSGTDYTEDDFKNVVDGYFDQLNVTDRKGNKMSGQQYRDSQTSPLQQGANWLNDQWKNVTNTAGSGLDWLYDNTLGAGIDTLLNIDTRGATNADNMGTVFDIGTDLALTALGPVGWGIVAGKNAVQNADSIGRGLSGKDIMTGEQLSSGDQLSNLLGGVGATALAAVPVAGKAAKALKGAKAVEAAAEAAKGAEAVAEASKVAEDAGEAGKAAEAAGKITKATKAADKAGEVSKAAETAGEAAKKQSGFKQAVGGLGDFLKNAGANALTGATAAGMEGLQAQLDGREANFGEAALLGALLGGLGRRALNGTSAIANSNPIKAGRNIASGVKNVPSVASDQASTIAKNVSDNGILKGGANTIGEMRAAKNARNNNRGLLAIGGMNKAAQETDRNRYTKAQSQGIDEEKLYKLLSSSINGGNK